jgi:hypothetical protein
MNISDQNPKPESHAFAAVNPQAFKGKRGTGQRCTNCNRDGHLREGCWILYPHLRPKWKGQGGGSARNQGEPPRKAYLAETLDSRQEAKRNESVGDSSVRNESIRDNSAQLNRLESSVNRLSAILGQQAFMGHQGFRHPSHLFTDKSSPLCNQISPARPDFYLQNKPSPCKTNMCPAQ